VWKISDRCSSGSIPRELSSCGKSCIAIRIFRLGVMGTTAMFPLEAPGLGVEINETEARKHPFQHEVLGHMVFHPDGSVAGMVEA
jgi:hypothetical protein